MESRVGSVSRAPPSSLVAASCLIFLLPGLYAHAHGDAVTLVLSILQAVLSLSADYVGNAGILPEGPVRLMCACDKGVATSFALWLVALSVATVSPWMCLALAPLGPVLAWSRASHSRAEWILRHSAWHVFAVGEALAVLATVYRAEGELPQSSQLAQLAMAPIAMGFAVAAFGMRRSALQKGC